MTSHMIRKSDSAQLYIRGYKIKLTLSQWKLVSTQR
ncbi:hypothetical protein SRABI82_03350 [Priestia megaterium]|jgi:hypothetical protein|nr:hypothetical protein SRABI82_03350 [Priestia megaterium]